MNAPNGFKRARNGGLDLERIRADFPILSLKVHGKPLVFLDNAASSQMPQPVLDRWIRYQTTQHSNIHRAVHHLSGPCLVLAGAGSGKTRVIVQKIARLLDAGIGPGEIAAITFTNKAAAEMRERIEALLGFPTRNLWIGTFHGLAHRLLRIHSEAAGLAEGFQIMDSDDQVRLIRRMLRALEIDENVWVPKEIAWFINAQKDEGLRPKDLRDEGNAGRRQMIDLYARYEKQCAAASLVDFGELLLRSLELLRDNPELLRQYRDRFRHVLVDEFQDTNTIQYAWMKTLVGAVSVPYVVGDDDQSIYRWRGARVENLQQYRKDFQDVQLYRLEQKGLVTSWYGDPTPVRGGRAKRFFRPKPAAIKAHADSGGADITLASTGGYEVQAHTDSGGISAPEMTISGEISRRRVAGKVRGGGPLVDVRTDSGRISIH